MHVSYAAIALAYHIVIGKPFPDDLAFETASKQLEDEGHYALLCECARIENIDWRNPEPKVAEVREAILGRYRIKSLDWEGKTRYLKNLNGFVPCGYRVNGYIITGGSAPASANSTGHVWVDNGERYPQVFGMEWV